jgi:hypothetical protein
MSVQDDISGVGGFKGCVDSLIWFINFICERQEGGKITTGDFSVAPCQFYHLLHNLFYVIYFPLRA